ncbi:MAG: class III extradiol ring-cleavage dioxygenase [Cyanobacteriota bacterium]|nr:class III extradiol ring-cleavage dioxygenase [Cyanobacteriota bacterium]
MDNPSVTQGHVQILYFSHGGGPLPILGDASHQAMVEFMGWLPTQLKQPETIVVISAHWEAPVATVLGTPNPSLLYDYYGFPRAAYTLTYSVPGDPALANQLVQGLYQRGISACIEAERGLDHGVFIPLMLMYPEGDIPVLQVSLLANLDPVAHIALGQALGQLVPENTLVLGSGFSFHNLQGFSWSGERVPDPANDAFQNWLITTVCDPSLDQQEREHRLINWSQAPSARYCHPREEHLLPLHLCVAMAHRPGQLVFDDLILGKRGVAFLWR